MNYHKITKTDTANGEGVRVTLWLSGCDHHCKGCHNPQTWNKFSGRHFNHNSYVELMDALDKPWISGLTLSGGDPLNHNNIDVVARIVGCVKYNFPNKNIWCYTGYTLEELWARANYDKHLDYILRHIDILVDGKYIEDLRDISYPWAGSSNQRIWANVNGEWVQSEYEKYYREKLNAKSNTPIQE